MGKQSKVTYSILESYNDYKISFIVSKLKLLSLKEYLRSIGNQVK